MRPSSDRDTGYAPPRWVFDAEVARVFGDMLERSVPEYRAMRAACFEVARPFVRPGTAVIDLGCARGEALAPFVECFGAQCRYVGIDASGPMLEAARRRFAPEIARGEVDIREADLRAAYPPEPASLTLAILTLQFIPVESRRRVVQNACERTLPGGALVVIEKVLGASPAIDDIMARAYYRMKSDHGYSPEDIERKRLSLEGVLVPVTARWNEELLATAGFRKLDCFWRWMNFAGWIAIKG